MNSASNDVELTDGQREFMEFCRDQNVLRFDTDRGFTLKSGRISPWFFNAGNLMQTAEGLQCLTQIYVKTLLGNFWSDGKVDADILYGVPHKGLPLVSTVAVELHRQAGQNLGIASHRKEAKDHGADIGRRFGKSVAWQRSILLDDVITAGTAARQAITDIINDGGTVNGMVVLIDRQEVATPDGWDATVPPSPGEERVSAIMQLKAEGIRVVPTFTFAHVRQAVREGIFGNDEVGSALDAHNRKYWVNPQ